MEFFEIVEKVVLSIILAAGIISFVRWARKPNVQNPPKSMHDWNVALRLFRLGITTSLIIVIAFLLFALYLEKTRDPTAIQREVTSFCKQPNGEQKPCTVDPE